MDELVDPYSASLPESCDDPVNNCVQSCLKLTYEKTIQKKSKRRKRVFVPKLSKEQRDEQARVKARPIINYIEEVVEHFSMITHKDKTESVNDKLSPDLVNEVETDPEHLSEGL